MASFLEKVLEVKSREIREDPEYIKHLEELIEHRSEHHDFISALRSCRTKLYESAGATAISVLTDREFFGGSLEDLQEVRKAVSLPLLRKDFIVHKVQVLEAKAYGADTLLLIVRILSPDKLSELVEFSRELDLEPLVEVFSLEEAKVALDVGARVIGINNRDLDTLKVDLNLTKELAPKVKEIGAEFVIAESGIDSREQIEELTNYNVDAFLVGTSLMKSEDPYGKLKELLGFPCDR